MTNMIDKIYNEEDFIQLSSLQHYAFCKRQCALIHIEQVWAENAFTVQGRIMHENVHKERNKIQKGIKIEYGMPIHSFKLGLSGKADIVEFHKSSIDKLRVPFPIEYKRGKQKYNNCDKIQLCAQALCLEEMCGIPVPKGALFYGKTQRRYNVEFDELIRNQTIETAHQVHKFLLIWKTPPPSYSKKCKSCSLIDICMPKAIENSYSIQKYLAREIYNK